MSSPATQGESPDSFAYSLSSPPHLRSQQTVRAWQCDRHGQQHRRSRIALPSWHRQRSILRDYLPSRLKSDMGVIVRLSRLAHNVRLGT